MKKIFAVLLCVLLMASLTACARVNIKLNTKKDTTAVQSDNADTSAGESVFETDKFDITLPEGYHLSNNLIPEGSNVDLMITDARDNIGLMFIEEPFSIFENTEITSLDSYLNWIHDHNPGNNVSEIRDANGEKYFTYTFLNTDLGYTYQYYTTAKVSNTAYWSIQCFCLQSQYEELEPDFMRWVDSIRFH